MGGMGAQFVPLAEQTLDAARWRKTHFLSSVDLSNLAAWWLCSPVALWWAQDGSVWASVLRDVPHVSFHHPLHRSSKSCSLVFWKGLISWRESGFFFLFFPVLICYRWHFVTTVPKSKGSEWNLFRKMMLVTAWLCSQHSEKISNKICVGFLCSWLCFEGCFWKA